MKDEIKEILDDLRKTADNNIFIVCSTQEELDKMPKYTANFLSINDRKAKLLLDYITNLQEENDYLKDIVSNTELSNEIKKADKWSKRELYKINYQRLKVNQRLIEENERLKEQCKKWKENHKAVCIQRDNILDNIVKDTEDRIDYKSRNEKAIKIYENSNSIKYKKKRFMEEKNTSDLMYEALQGSDDNE